MRLHNLPDGADGHGSAEVSSVSQAWQGQAVEVASGPPNKDALESHDGRVCSAGRADAQRVSRTRHCLFMCGPSQPRIHRIGPPSDLHGASCGDTRTYTQDTYLGDDSPLVGFKFEVEAVWKGSVPQVAYLSAIVGDGDACADLPYSTDLIVGVRYLVYTYESMELHLCSLVFREYEDGHSDQYLIEIMGTFEEQVANLGPAKAFSGAGTDPGLKWRRRPTNPISKRRCLQTLRANPAEDRKPRRAYEFDYCRRFYPRSHSR